jgi:hypothetical protein
LGKCSSAIVLSQPPIEPSQEQSATKNQGKHPDEKYDVTLWDRWFPDSISLYTLFLVVFTAVLAIGGVYQLKFLGRAEQIAAKTAEAAKDSADIARESLIATQRAFLRVANFPWLWRPDFDRPGKYFYDITPLVENAGNTPTVDMKLIVTSALRDMPLPDNFDFTYGDVKPEPSLIGGHQTIGAHRAYILDDDLLAVQKHDKFFYIWGTITYRDVFKGTPLRTTEFCTEINRVMGNPLDPRESGNPKGTTVEISFRVYPKHQKID